MTNQNGLVRATRLNKEGFKKMERRDVMKPSERCEAEKVVKRMQPAEMPTRGADYLFVQRLDPWR